MTKSIEEKLEPLKESLPPTDQMFASRSMSFQVDLDPEVLKKQKLMEVRPFFALICEIPSSLSRPGMIVMRALFDCFDRQKKVEEGILDDLLWGFEQCGIEKLCTYDGLVNLHKEGYVDFLTLDYMPMPDPRQAQSPRHVWVKYRKKLLDMVYSK